MTSYMVSIEPLVTAKMIDGAVTIAVAALADLTMRRRNSGSSSAPPHHYRLGKLLFWAAADRRETSRRHSFPFFAHFLTMAYLLYILDSCGHHFVAVASHYTKRWMSTTRKSTPAQMVWNVFYGLENDVCVCVWEDFWVWRVWPRTPEGFHFQQNRISGSS